MRGTRLKTALLAAGAAVAMAAWPGTASAQETHENEAMEHERPEMQEHMDQQARNDDEFAKLDRNRDEKIDLAEMSDGTPVLDVLFVRWDKNADEQLSREEIKNGLFRLWDRNDDGVVSEREFKRSADRSFSANVNRRSFVDWDRDGDSELDMDEVSEGLDRTNWNEVTTEGTLVKSDFSKAWFRIWDQDNDGYLEKSEWNFAFNDVFNDVEVRDNEEMMGG